MPHIPEEIVEMIIYKYQERPEYIKHLNRLFDIINNKTYIKEKDFQEFSYLFKKKRFIKSHLIINGKKISVEYPHQLRDLSLYNMRNTNIDKYIRDGVLEVNENEGSMTVYKSIMLDRPSISDNYVSQRIKRKPNEDFIKDTLWLLNNHITWEDLRRLTGNKKIKNKKQLILKYFDVIVSHERVIELMNLKSYNIPRWWKLY